MRITCPTCETSYGLADGALGASGRKVRCTRCGTTWHARPFETGGHRDEAAADGLPAPIGIGISSPGPLDPWRGVVRAAPNLLGWNDFPLGPRVRDALSEALRTRHSRFPVLNGDGVLGVVHLSQLARGLLEQGEDAPVRSLAGPALFVPETQPVDELLRQLQARRASMAVVLDEYGDFSGVVTVEDVIEEIVGEIDDERDRAPAVDAPRAACPRSDAGS